MTMPVEPAYAPQMTPPAQPPGPPQTDLNPKVAAWEALADAAGGWAALASEVGVSRVNLHQWRTGKPVAGALAVSVEVAAWRRGLASPLTDEQRGAIHEAYAVAAMVEEHRKLAARRGLEK